MDSILRNIAIGASLALVAGTFATVAMAGDANHGAQVFRGQCAVCHSSTANAGPTVGPRLFGVVGRHAGTQPGYAYSNAMKNSGLVWSPAELKLYLANPAGTVHGNKMPYPGLHNPAQLDDLVTYLGSLK
jgi:cytochrome c